MTNLNLSMVCYSYHDDSSSNSIETAIRNALPAILIDNTAHSLWGNANVGGQGGSNNCIPANYSSYNIKVFGYITSGYEGTEYGTNEDSLSVNQTRIAGIATDGAYGVFLDEVTNTGLTTPNKTYLSGIYSTCQAHGLKLIINTGVNSFDYAYLSTVSDYIMTNEVYTGTSPSSSETNYGLSKVLVVNCNTPPTEAQAVTWTKAAWSNGYGYAWMTDNTSYNLPSWLSTYISGIQSTSANKDINTRLKVIAVNYSYIASRFKLVGINKDFVTRIKVITPAAGLSFPLNFPLVFGAVVQPYQYFTSRFKTWVVVYKTINTRFKEIVLSYKDFKTRFKEIVLSYKDFKTRFKVQTSSSVNKDIGTRFKEIVLSYKDFKTRFKVQTSSSVNKDIGTRFSVSPPNYSDSIFNGGGLVYNNVSLGGPNTDKISVISSNIFNILNIDASDEACTVIFTDGSTQTVNYLTRDTVLANVITLTGTGTSGWNIVSATDSPQTSLDYLDISYSKASPDKVWYAGNHSTDGGNNDGWYFIEYPRVRRPITTAEIYRFLNGQVPSVLNDGTRYTPGVVSCNINAGFDQVCATADITIISPLDDQGNEVTFKPMDRVVINQGWNDSSALKISFYGFITEVHKVMPGNTQKIVCNDIMLLPQDKFILSDDEYVYATTQLAGYYMPDGITPIDCHIPETERYMQNVVSELLVDCGIPKSFQNLPDCSITTASGVVPLVVASQSPVILVNTSTMDAINMMCDYTGYEIWADPAGMVTMENLPLVAADNPSIILQTQIEKREDSQVTVLRVGNIINIESVVESDDLRNWVSVYNVNDPTIKSTVFNDSPYVPNPPRYRKTEISSALYDSVTSEYMAVRLYNSLNRLRYTAKVTCEGRNDLRLGATVRVIDEYSTNGEGIDYILYDYSTTHDTTGWRADLDLVGGTGEGSPPAGLQYPHASFVADIIQNTDMNGTQFYSVNVDASNSYDPDGKIASYQWSSAGYSTVSGSQYEMYSYKVPITTTDITIVLDVTDNDGLVDSMTQSFQLTPNSGSNIVQSTIYIANGTNMVLTPDGGTTWDTLALY